MIHLRANCTKKEQPEKRTSRKQPACDQKEIPIEIDLDGISNRIIEFPVSEGIFDQVIGLSDKAIFNEFPIHDGLEDLSVEGKLEKNEGILWVYDFNKQEIEKIVDNCGNIEVSAATIY